MIRKALAGDTSELAWFKSSYSDGPNGEECIEIATTPTGVHIRDSKLTSSSPTFQVTPTTWSTFISHTTSP
ncbi:DUF397 domain-containing protein [Streptomyces niveiscabiei]|uniref:DUF397 domain-containing protein n=1 Tax=Streptomyces niveiscabiei TaxID=164115 RepID=UPI0029A9B04E|nr:DUF397 domain-containing protein [Streptomyces niveiscabiei]MDX3383778.1 DUF397 domain-containing protein [Streptomyces niveiscabiei]